MDITLNGGNYGGVAVEASADNAIAIKDGATYWLYDPKLHRQTSTADFVGCCTEGDDQLIGATVIDMTGA